jgi:DNA (cytosine-5)-methyltransferase 1
VSAYYNDNDQFMVEWLKHLIKRKVIADGEVDGRSITEVTYDDIKKFKQCHFFAGIGVWPYVLRRAGWPDDLPVWTGSAPYPSFSASGERKGFSDPRHLWPSWFRLIAEHRPVVILGEQVAKEDGRAWFDVVSAELEEVGYTIGAAAIPACGFGAPHIRERIYFVAHTDGIVFPQITRARDEQILRNDSQAHAMADTQHDDGRADEPERRSKGRKINRRPREGSAAVAKSKRGRRKQRDAQERRVQKPRTRSASLELGESNSTRLERFAGNVDDKNKRGRIDQEAHGSTAEAGPTNGYWADAIWIECSDGKLRPISPELSFFPVVDGLARGRVGLIRGAGNALVAPAAQAFVEAFIEEMHGYESD